MKKPNTLALDARPPMGPRVATPLTPTWKSADRSAAALPHWRPRSPQKMCYLKNQKVLPMS